MLHESCEIARHLLAGADDEELKRLLTLENILHKRSAGTALRQAVLIKKRLRGLTSEGWQMLVTAPRDVQLQLLLAASVKHSRLLGDFMLYVVKPRWQAFETHLRPTDWPHFLEDCRQIDPVIDTWSATTRVKLGQMVRKSLVEAGYLADVQTWQITPRFPVPEVVAYLQREGEAYALKCLSIFE